MVDETPGYTVLRLDEEAATSLAAAGGKGANLARLTRAGFPVPAGFVVATTVYDEAVRAAGLVEQLADLEAGASPADRLPELAVPPGHRAALLRAYHELGDVAVAVRSSATAEDLPDAAFAGQQETFLDVRGDEALLRAVAGCWASLWSERALAYRRHRSGPDAGVSIAVVVQVMVPAEVAGVAFTAHPVTGDRELLVVDAAAGLGEAVVSGSVTPDQYVLDRRGRRRQGPRAGVLDRAQLRALAGQADLVQALFGGPQDIEWAFAGGRLWLLQARPMTALPPAPPHLDAFRRVVAPFYLEMFSERPYPLDVTGWFALGIADMLARMAASVGVRFPPAAELLPEQDGVVTVLVPPRPRPTARVLFAPASVLRRAARYPPWALTEDPRFVEYTARVAALQAEEQSALSGPELLEVVDRCFAATRLVTELRVSYLPGAFLPRLRLELLLALLGRRALGPALVAGAPSRTTETNAALGALADRVRADAVLREAFATEDTGRLEARLGTDPRFAGFAAAFAEFLARYGHRETVSVVLSSSPTWSAAPETVLGLVQALLGQTRPPADVVGDAARRLDAHPLLRVPRLRRAVDETVAASRDGLAVREDTHFYLTMVLPALRRTLLELGRRLVGVGVLERPDDVFHLRLDELRGLGGGAAEPDDAQRRHWRAVVERRAQRRAALAPYPLLDLAVGRERRPPAGALLAGTGASPGRASGPARLVTGPAAFGSLRPGEVLVCPYTNPSWTPLFLRAAAVVVDTGGLGSHAAIVAREYGIPAVMGTGSGTRTLTDGQQVTVDGSRGLVLVAAPGAEG